MKLNEIFSDKMMLGDNIDEILIYINCHFDAVHEKLKESFNANDEVGRRRAQYEYVELELKYNLYEFLQKTERQSLFGGLISEEEVKNILHRYMSTLDFGKKEVVREYINVKTKAEI